MNREMKKLALLAGIGYLVIFISGIYANFTVIEPLKSVFEDTSILPLFEAAIGDLRMAIVAFVCMILADLLLTWALYELFREQFPKTARLAAWLRLVNVAVFAVALKDLMQMVSVINEPSLGEELKQIFLEQHLQSFDFTWLCGLLFFGAHLILLGSILWKTGKVTRIIGGLLYIAGCGYLVDSMAHILLPNYSEYAELFALTVIVPGVVGELSLTFWLLGKGLFRSKQLINTIS